MVEARRLQLPAPAIAARGISPLKHGVPRPPRLATKGANKSTGHAWLLVVDGEIEVTRAAGDRGSGRAGLPAG
jgi:hypothetical protein